MLLGLVVPLLGAAAYVDLGLVTQWQRQAAPRVVRPSVGHRRVLSPPQLLQGFPEDGDDDDEGSGMPEEEMMSDDSERQKVEDFRAQMLRQMLGGEAPDEPNAVDQMLGADGAASEPAAPEVVNPSALAAGQVLVANPERFCSRNPFSRPVRDLSRFGLQGPIDDDDLSSDMKAQMLPVLLLIEHSSGGSRALLMERRTGALMGDVSMEDYGCVAISPLWLGGTSKQNSLYVVHDVEGLEGATLVSEGLWMGGWPAARPQVADSSLAEGRFKFFIGATEWNGGQLEDEIKAGAWLPLSCDPSTVIKDRVMGWRPGRPKPVWTELMGSLGTSDAERILKQIYPNRE